ncbi:MAG: bifunctional 5,10-methylenetetrahydrofolate dehydrogenase/5,10-methenyltetrahydrofolate cyclohydrolase [TACK group archaeon]|nr:bifunctional 5,10-methylenetetrahydrofolate dehydrogenase/5,10-methenyltetrahydrofolate cyclohydrolase [TACK group archaeon]
MILDGRPVAAKLESKILEEAIEFERAYGIKASLHSIVIGKDEVANLFADIMLQKLRSLNMAGEAHRLPEDVSEKEVADLMKDLSSRDDVHGIIVNVPIPAHLNKTSILSNISVEKDVDGQNPYSLGMIMLGHEDHSPVTPLAVIKLLDEYNIQLSGKNVCIINRTSVVGRPLAMLLLNRDATVSICHTKTVDLEKHTRSSDIIIVAVGKPLFLKENMVSEKSIVIDVGINKYNGRTVGDADFESLVNRVYAITPVPGGVGSLKTLLIIERALRNAQKLVHKYAKSV